jgi:tetratricopeptide (TPR) repeat protein
VVWLNKKIPYVAFVVLLVAVIVMAATTFYALFSSSKTNDANKMKLEELQVSLQELQKYAKDNPESNIEIILRQNNAGLAEAISLTQYQYDSFTDHVNVLIAILAVSFTIISVAMPLMNYVFIQKDTIKSLEREQSRIKNEFEKQIEKNEAAFEQYQQVIENIGSTGATEDAGFDFKLQRTIDPTSNDKPAIAHALYLQAMTKSNKIDAILDMNKAIENDETRHMYYNYRGYLYYMIGEEDNAIGDLKIALDKYPPSTRCIENYVGILTRNPNDLDNWERAKDKVEYVIKKIEERFPHRIDRLTSLKDKLNELSNQIERLKKAAAESVSIERGD